MKIAYGRQKRLAGKTKKLIESINGIVEEYSAQGLNLTVRQVYYQLVSRGLMPNKKAAYERISDVIADGRLAGLIDWDCIEDRTRSVREIQHWDNPQQILRAATEQYRIDTRVTQPCYIEAWIEKDSLVSILEDTCYQLDVPCFSCRGYPSITALHEAAERFEGKNNPIILYAGDHDPSGLMIPQIISERLQAFGVNVKLNRIGLTLDQIRELDLPPFYAKEKDKNYKTYVQNTGLTQAWELDALDPAKLSSIFTEAINSLTNHEALRDMQERENKDKSYFSQLLDR